MKLITWSRVKMCMTAYVSTDRGPTAAAAVAIIFPPAGDSAGRVVAAGRERAMVKVITLAGMAVGCGDAGEWLPWRP